MDIYNSAVPEITVHIFCSSVNIPATVPKDRHDRAGKLCFDELVFFFCQLSSPELRNDSLIPSRFQIADTERAALWNSEEPSALQAMCMHKQVDT